MYAAEWSPWQFRSCLGVRGNQMKKKKEYRIGNKPIPYSLGEKLFHYSLIDTSKRICKDNAISIEAILHAERKGKLCTCIRKGEEVILKDPLGTPPYICAAFRLGL